MLQPFPPPAPPPSLTPSSAATPPLISRDKVRDALLMLAQDDQFIDMFHQTLLKLSVHGNYVAYSSWLVHCSVVTVGIEAASEVEQVMSQLIWVLW
ncbi:DECAPPING 1-RELATED [Salix koriyanagi]|uniref:DECAPPING 1-RELATED n=1 Tax=Salix koriyanagi TaxID=2511006 RepID=A0A9Q1AP13_9ROSI|nr:DECAPPING 1-RELATED [Salix koriyanagi]